MFIPILVQARHVLMEISVKLYDAFRRVEKMGVTAVAHRWPWIPWMPRLEFLHNRSTGSNDATCSLFSDIEDHDRASRTGNIDLFDVPAFK